VQQSLASNTVGMDSVFKEFWEGCFKAGPLNCPFMSHDDWGNGPGDAEDGFWTWLQRVDDAPIVTHSAANDAIVITGNHVRRLIGKNSYDPATSFRPLATFLYAGMTSQLDRISSLFAVDPGPGLGFSNQTGTRHEAQAFGGTEAMTAVICADGQDIFHKSPEWWIRYVKTQEGISRVLGRAWTMSRARCHRWPFKPNWRFTGPFTAPKPSNKGLENAPLAPVLFVSSQHDPVTPVSSARKMVKKFRGSQLVIQKGVGHTAWRNGYTNCVRSWVSRYFHKGVVPTKTVQCPVICDVWDEACNAQRTLSTDRDGDGVVDLNSQFWPLHVPA
ncbi:hypothetical protein E4U54_007524, partial [Claviceps lovelessii]